MRSGGASNHRRGATEITCDEQECRFVLHAKHVNAGDSLEEEEPIQHRVEPRVRVAADADLLPTEALRLGLHPGRPILHGHDVLLLAAPQGQVANDLVSPAAPLLPSALTARPPRVKFSSLPALMRGQRR